MLFTQNAGRRLLCIVLSLVIFALIAIPTQAEEDESAMLGSTCLVRYGASANAMVIGHMEDGAQITVLDDYGSYYKIDCYDMNGYVA